MGVCGQRSFTAAALAALALVLDTSVQGLFRADSGQVELPGRAIAPEDYRGILLNRQNDSPLDGLEELIVALHDIGEVLQRPNLARLVRIARAAEQAPGSPHPRLRAASSRSRPASVPRQPPPGQVIHANDTTNRYKGQRPGHGDRGPVGDISSPAVRT